MNTGLCRLVMYTPAYNLYVADGCRFNTSFVMFMCGLKGHSSSLRVEQLNKYIIAYQMVYTPRPTNHMCHGAPVDSDLVYSG